MAEVTVVRPGYAVTEPDGRQRAGGTITLVRGTVTMLVDTGTVRDRELILGALAGNGLGAGDVDYVVCTHGHADHIANNGLFPQARIVAAGEVFLGDEYRSIDYAAGPYRITDDISILYTPGHTSEDISVLVRTARGTVAIAGDLFEHADDLHDESRWSRWSRYPDQQRASRAQILALVDFIVPGHGDLFPVPKPPTGHCGS